MIKAIIFDCYGVLTEDKWHVFRVALPHGPNEQAQKLMLRYCDGLLTQQEFIQQAATVTGRTPQQIHDLITNEDSKNTPLLNYIACLRRTYRIGLLSNIANNWVRDTFLTPTEQELFDDMVFSFEVHITKPDPHIFELAARNLSVQPQECVFVDDIDRYCAGAQAVGMQAIVYQNFPQLQRDLEALLANSNA